MNILESFGIVIFGASGDLASKKLIPALYNLYKQNLFKTNFYILGTGRTKLDDTSFRIQMKNRLIAEYPFESNNIEGFINNLFYISFNPLNDEEFNILKNTVQELNQVFNPSGNQLFYLSVPPSLYSPVARNLHLQGLTNEQKGWKRLIIEKPFGTDYQTAYNLNRELLKYFKEDQLYRIDHFLGKETVQNILVTRFSNTVFEPVWNRNYIHHVEITAAESIGIDERGGYYEQSGALRDMIQNHLMQLLALTAMEPPAEISSNSIRNETLKVFQSLKPMDEKEIEKISVRGQYTASVIKGEKIKGYREEEGVNPASKTETYAAVKCYIENWRWEGIPFYLRSGKRLPTRVTEIVIHFKYPPLKLFCNTGDGFANQLILRIQPDEGVLMKFGMKIPGAGFKVQHVNMDFHYKDLAETKLPEAYERLILDCLQGDSTLYIRGDSVETTWQFLDPLLTAWKNNPNIPVYGYPAGTWGPTVADDLMEGKNLKWRYPCKNLSDDGAYCEL